VQAWGPAAPVVGSASSGLGRQWWSMAKRTSSSAGYAATWGEDLGIRMCGRADGTRTIQNMARGFGA